MMHDREQRRTMRTLRFGILVIAMFCISGFKSCTEIRYRMSGVVTQARVHKFFPTDDNMMWVDYRFLNDEGRWEKGHYLTPESSWPVMNPPKEVEVIYLPGKAEVNQLAADRSVLWMVVFGGMCVALVAWLVVLYRKAQRGEM